MTVVNVHEAKTHFSRLLARVRAGERIIIAKAGRPIAELVPIVERPGKRPLGLNRGALSIGSDWDDPLPDFEGYA